MLAARYYNNRDIRLEELPKPEIGEGEILVKVKASGICGTDVMEWYRTQKGPRILGHEISGEIVESRSPEYKTGQRVFVSHHVPCYNCQYCHSGRHTACETLHLGNYHPGGYSEYVRVPEINVKFGVYLLPDHVSYEEGVMIEPLACAIRGQRLVKAAEGETVLVLGSGVSGLLNIKIAKLNGAKVAATDIDEYRKQKAREFGADSVFDANDDFHLEAEKVILCAGAQRAVEQAFENVDRKGSILLFAIPSSDIKIPTVNFWRNEITLTSSYGAAPEDLEESLRLISENKINVKDFITHRLPLSEIQKGFDLTANAKNSLKVVLLP